MNILFKPNIVSFNVRNTISFVLLIASFVLLVFGVTEPMLEISAEHAGRELFTYKQSIMEAVDTLYEGQNYLVAFLILFFSVMIPGFKGVVILWVFFFGGFKLARYVSLLWKQGQFWRDPNPNSENSPCQTMRAGQFLSK